MESRIYRIEGFELDTSQLCLRHDGREQHLRQKSFQVLVCLVEQCHRVVSKDELIEKVWAGAAITDNTLNQSLAEIRRALSDDSRNPRFVKTIPRQGYRFIGAVEEIAAEESPRRTDEPPRIASAQLPNVSRSPGSVSRPNRRLTALVRRPAVIVLLLVVVGLMIFAYSVRRRSSTVTPLEVTLPQEANKMPVAVMFFDNESGTPDLDWLREGLPDMIITDLSRSTDIAVLSRQQLHILFERAGHNLDDKVRLDEALEVAKKSQARIVVLGSFARLGEQILISVQLHNASDGQLLTAERVVVDKPDQILTQVDLLSLKLASYLSASGRQKDSNADLTSVMTNNLEAYRYYSLGVEKAEALRNAEAIALLEKAIALDPQFAMAYARIGYIYAVSWGPFGEKAKPYLEKAFQFSNRLSEKDKLYINAWYAVANSDYSRAIDSYRQIVARYPLEIEAYYRLGTLLDGEERSAEAVEIEKQGLVIDSGAKELYNAMGGSLLELGHIDEAITAFQYYVALAPQEENAHDSLAGAYEWAGRYPEAIDEYRHALALNPNFEIALVHLGNTYFQAGRYREAIKQFEQYIAHAPSDFERMRGYGSTAFVYRSSGDQKQAERAALAAERYGKVGVGELFMLALDRRDWANAAKYKKLLEGDDLRGRGGKVSQRELLFFRGEFELKQGHVTEAIDQFKDALKQTPWTWNVDAHEDCLANAYLEVGRFDEAISEYERIMKINPNYPLAHFHLAQAYEGKGQKDQARAEYQQFLQVWKDADSDIPKVITARKAVAD